MPSAQSTPQQPIFRPKLWTTLRSYTVDLFWKDLSSGVIVGIVALPLAIAFAIASGVTPDRGLVTAIIAGFLISVFGGSRVQIGGPTGAFVVIVYHIVQVHGLNGLLLCTIMAGFLLIVMGTLRLGAVIRFIPYPLIVGFTAGIAVIIFSSQMKDFLGLQTGPLPGEFIGKWEAYFHAVATISPTTAALSVLSLLILFAWPKIPKVSVKIPGSIVAILFVTALVQLLHLPTDTIGSRFGALPSGLPRPALPHFSFGEIRDLIVPAFTVALLGAIESLLSATVADGMIEGRHRSNTELIGQGIANIITPLFGGIPATGAIARTATNVKNGGRTPVAGLIHALMLLLIVLLFGRWAALIPLCVLAAILIQVAYNMSEWHAFKNLLRAPKMDVAVLLVTFSLTVLVDLTVAVEVGMLLSVVLFMKRMTDVTTVREIAQGYDDQLDEDALRRQEDAASRRQIPQGVLIYEAEGAFFFGAAELLRDRLNMVQKGKVLILRMRHVLVLDATGLRALADLKKQCDRKKTALILEGIHAQPYMALERSEILEEFGPGKVVADLDQALQKARELIAAGS